MSAKLIKTKFIALIALLLLASMIILPLAQTMLSHHAASPVVQTSPCHKNAQSSTKSCSSAKLQLNMILPDVLNPIIQFVPGLSILFILSLATLSLVNRIYKPPRLNSLSY